MELCFIIKKIYYKRVTPAGVRTKTKFELHP